MIRINSNSDFILSIFIAKNRENKSIQFQMTSEAEKLKDEFRAYRQASEKEQQRRRNQDYCMAMLQLLSPLSYNLID